MLGFENVGNSCYLNTLMQCLIHLDTTHHAFENVPIHNKVAGFFKQILSFKKESKKEDVADIRNFLKEICDTSHSMFEVGHQHDSCELYLWLIDQLHEGTHFQFDVKDHVNGPIRKIWDTLHRMQHGKYSKVLDTFQGVHIHLMECNNCKNQPYNIEPYTTIYIDTPANEENVSVAECIMKQFHIEDMSEWKCDKCNLFGGKRQMRLWNIPKVMVIALKRFDNQMRKINTPVLLQDTLTFSEGALLSSPKSCSYKLKAIANHFGSYRGGHYTAIVYDSDRKEWIHWDDASHEIVKDISKLFEKNQHAYLLFYELVL